MTFRNFIRENKTEIDAAINSRLTFVPREAGCYCSKSGTNHHHEAQPLNDEDRREWIINDEYLYGWARSEGVRI